MSEITDRIKIFMDAKGVEKYAVVSRNVEINNAVQRTALNGSANSYYFLHKVSYTAPSGIVNVVVAGTGGGLTLDKTNISQDTFAFVAPPFTNQVEVMAFSVGAADKYLFTFLEVTPL